jgi:DNA-binding response OmpR family regulator
VTRILIVEDNESLAFGLRNNLELEGHEVLVAETGTKGLDLARNAGADLILLDLMLPELDGFRVLKSLRESDEMTPVLILTARGEEADKVRGLRLGADDFVTKPFGLLELLARIDAMLRRRRFTAPGSDDSMEPIRIGDIVVDPATRCVTKAGQPVELAPKEYELLVVLASKKGAVVSRIDLMREVWGYADSVITRTIDTHVAELRRKLEDDSAEPRHILTVRKVGYRLVE